MFRLSFQADPRLSARLFNLLEDVFPGVSAGAQRARQIGAAWEDASIPFVWEKDGVVVAHAGLLEVPLKLMGQDVRAAGVHAVCTRPEYRRRGYCRSLIEELLAFAEGRYETLFLTTDQPGLYTPFGFRVLGEHLFVAAAGSPGNPAGARPLNLSQDGDRALLLQLLARRDPVSEVVGVGVEQAVFCYYAGDQPLVWIEALNAIVWGQVQAETLHLYDVVTPHMPSLEALLAHVAEPVERTAVYFSPDKLDTPTQPFAHILDGDSLLMVRGPFAAEGQPFMLPRTARC